MKILKNGVWAGTGAVLLLAMISLYLRIQGSRASVLVSPLMEVATVAGMTVEATTPAEIMSSPSSIVATPSLVATPSASPEITPTAKPLPTPVPTSATSQQINEFIDRYSAQYGIDPNVVRYVAICESGFNPSAVNGPYVGLFQFDSVTWSNMRRQIGENPDPELRFVASDAVQTAIYSLAKGKSKLWPNCMPH